MHVLVTGGTGFIGKALCRDIIESGDTLSVLTRSAARAAEVLPQGVRPVEQMSQLRDGAPVEAIVNLAGENLGSGRWDAARKKRFIDSRVDTTRRLIEYIERAEVRPQVLVSGSAIGWYGARGDEPLDERSAPGETHEYQSQLCRAWENEAQRAEGLGVRVCRLRTGLVLARDGGSLKSMLLPFKLGLGGPLGDGRQWLSWIHRADLIALIRWLIRGPERSGPYNGTAPHPVTNRDFTKALGRVLHRPAVIGMPAPMVRLLVGEMAELMLTGQKVLPVRALEEGFAFKYPEIDTALRAILS